MILGLLNSDMAFPGILIPTAVRGTIPLTTIQSQPVSRDGHILASSRAWKICPGGGTCDSPCRFQTDRRFWTTLTGKTRCRPSAATFLVGLHVTLGFAVLDVAPRIEAQQPSSQR